MKVLGIAGSPRRGGNTDILLAEVLRGAASNGSEIKTIFLRDLTIAYCQHCDACLKAGKCKVQDDMQMVYRELEQADVIVLASPIQFAGLTGQVKTMIDRCQALWAKKYVLKLPPLGDKRERRGFFVSVAGRRTADFGPAIATVKTFFTVLSISYAGELLYARVDEKGAIAGEPGALAQAFAAGQKLAEAKAETKAVDQKEG